MADFLTFVAIVIGAAFFVWWCLRGERLRRQQEQAEYGDVECVRCRRRKRLRRYEWSAYKREDVHENIQGGNYVSYRSTVHGATDFVDFVCDTCVAAVERPKDWANVKSGCKQMGIAVLLGIVGCPIFTNTEEGTRVSILGFILVSAAFFVFFRGVGRLLGYEGFGVFEESNTANAPFEIIWECRKPHLVNLGYVGYKPYPTSRYT